MMYAIAMVAEREIPARQCTMTLQFDTLALSVGGGKRKKQKRIHNISAKSPERQSASVESKLTFPGRVQGGHLNGCYT